MAGRGGRNGPVRAPHIAAGVVIMSTCRSAPPLPTFPPVPLRDRSALRRQLAAATEDPFALARLVISGLLFLATLIAIILTVSGIAPRAWIIVLPAWAVYGVVHGLFDWVLEPLMGFAVQGIASIGVDRVGTAFSSIEAQAARGDAAGAAEAYLRRAANSQERVPALVRRAALLAGPLGRPADAVTELESLRRTTPDLNAPDDIAIGLALVDLHDFRLGDPGRAMAELRRLIDRHPQSHHIQRMRTMLAALRDRHFGEPIPQEPGA